MEVELDRFGLVLRPRLEQPVGDDPVPDEPVLQVVHLCGDGPADICQPGSYLILGERIEDADEIVLDPVPAEGLGLPFQEGDVAGDLPEVVMPLAGDEMEDDVVHREVVPHLYLIPFHEVVGQLPVAAVEVDPVGQVVAHLALQPVRDRLVIGRILAVLHREE